MKAQEYKYQVGGGAGFSYYIGEAAKGVVSPTNLNLTLEGKQKINLRWELGATISYLRISGKTSQKQDAYPDSKEASFTQNLIKLGAHTEFNFLPFSRKQKYLQTSAISPYILAGINLHYAASNPKFTLSPGIEIGFGVKYKFKDRMIATLVWLHSLSFSDGLDVSNTGNKWLSDPYHMNEFGTKSKDAFGMLKIGILYEIGEIKSNCEKTKF